MPYLYIQTNLDVNPSQKVTLLTEASQTVTRCLGKPEIYVMVALQTNKPMLFAGSDKPTAYLALKSIGLPTARTRELSRELCLFIEKSLKVPKERVYIEFINVEGALWGWNGETF